MSVNERQAVILFFVILRTKVYQIRVVCNLFAFFLVDTAFPCVMAQSFYLCFYTVLQQYLGLFFRYDIKLKVGSIN